MVYAANIEACFPKRYPCPLQSAPVRTEAKITGCPVLKKVYRKEYVAVFAVVAFSGATHDIAADGIYMSELSPAPHAKYIGWQGAFYNLAKLVNEGKADLLNSIN